MAFKTKLDYSSNRQIKQYPETVTVLSGATSFGVVFSALTTGPDLTTTAVTENYTLIASTFSGNSATTVYDWYDDRMELGASGLSAITPSTSASTQSTTEFTGSSSTIIDGNMVNLTYSGVSFDLGLVSMVDLGSGTYSGTVSTSNLDILTASTLDFTGRTIWNDVYGITRTKRLIITDTPVSGYVWTCIDSEGMGEWQYNGSSSGTTSFWEEGGSGDTALKDNKGLHTLSGVSTNSIIVGGDDNILGNSRYTAILGGLSNICNNNHYSLLSGLGNEFSTEGQSNLLIGGKDNIMGVLVPGFSAPVLYSSIIGGRDNFTNDNVFHGSIIGGQSNSILKYSRNSAILGGQGNTVNGVAWRSVVLGGQNITGTTPDTVYVPNLIINTGGTVSKLGINTSNPQYTIDAKATDSNLFFENSGSGARLTLSGSSDLPIFLISTGVGGVGTGVGGSVGVRAWDDTTYSPYGSPGDMHIYAGINANGLNLISADGSGGGAADYVRIYAGRSANMGGDADLHIGGTGSTKGYLGLNNENPQNRIDAKGSFGRFQTKLDSSNVSASISGKTTDFVFLEASTVDTSLIRVGVRPSGDTTNDAYGKKNDTFIYSSISNNGLNLISADGTGTEDYIRFYAGMNADDGTSNLHIHGTGSTKGYVGLNNEEPTERLDVGGNARVRGVGSSASAGALHYTADGTLTTNTSDERLKINITSLTGALDKVNQLRGVRYNWLESPSGDTRIGFIAQEVESIVPELTFTNKNSEEKYMGVHYDNVTALLVEAVKELSSGVTTNTNTHLETQTILAEDNNIDLNYNGTKESALGGGLTVLNAKGENESAELTTDENGDWVTNNDFKSKSLTIPLYTPTSTNDSNGSEGNITRDEDYMYIKTTSGWKRTNLENF